MFPQKTTTGQNIDFFRSHFETLFPSGNFGFQLTKQVIKTISPSNRPRILHISKHFLPVFGGLERFVHGLIKWSSDDFDHEVVCYNDDLAGNKNRLPQSEVIDGITVHRIPCFKPGFFHFGWIPGHLLSKADLIHVHNMDLLSDQVIARVKGKPILSSTHGFFFHHDRFAFAKKWYLSLSGLYRRVKPDVILATGKEDYLTACRFYGSERSILIPNPINYPENLPLPPPHRQGVIFISRLQENKRIDRVLNVFSLLREQGFADPLTLILSGNEPDIAGWMDIHRILVEKLAITSLFNIPEEKKWECLVSHQFMIQPSDYEGFGYSIAEALISGCRVLVSPTVFRNFEDLKNPGILAVNFSRLELVAKQIMEPAPVREIQANQFESWHWKNRIHEFKTIYRGYLNT